MWYNGSFVEDETYLKRVQRIEEVKKMLEGTGYTSIQIFLSCLLSTSKTPVPIPGAKIIDQIKENAHIIKSPPPQTLINEVDSSMKDLRTNV